MVYNRQSSACVVIPIRLRHADEEEFITVTWVKEWNGNKNENQWELYYTVWHSLSTYSLNLFFAASVVLPSTSRYLYENRNTKQVDRILVESLKRKWEFEQSRLCIVNKTGRNVAKNIRLTIQLESSLTIDRRSSVLHWVLGWFSFVVSAAATS